MWSRRSGFFTSPLYKRSSRFDETHQQHRRQPTGLCTCTHKVSVNQWPSRAQTARSQNGMCHDRACAAFMGSSDMPLMLLDEEVLHVSPPLEDCLVVRRVLVLLRDACMPGDLISSGQHKVARFPMALRYAIERADRSANPRTQDSASERTMLLSTPLEWMYSSKSPSRVRFLIWPSVMRSNCRSSSVHRVMTANLAPKDPTRDHRDPGYVDFECGWEAAPASMAAKELSDYAGANTWIISVEVLLDVASRSLSDTLASRTRVPIVAATESAGWSTVRVHAADVLTKLAHFSASACVGPQQVTNPVAMRSYRPLKTTLLSWSLTTCQNGEHGISCYLYSDFSSTSQTCTEALQLSGSRRTSLQARFDWRRDDRN